MFSGQAQELPAALPRHQGRTLPRQRLTDIVTDRFDAGARMGEHLAKDMISARIGPGFCLAVVDALSYLEGRAKPAHPKEPVNHTCINFRLPSSWGSLRLGIRGERARVREQQDPRCGQC
jgi:hypothetical protein